MGAEIDAFEIRRKGVAGKISAIWTHPRAWDKGLCMRSPTDQADQEKARTLQRPPSREDRLKAALKANMARRKAQAKARGAEDAPGKTEKD